MRYKDFRMEIILNEKVLEFKMVQDYEGFSTRLWLFEKGEDRVFKDLIIIKK
jgi:hypothetical protein